MHLIRILSGNLFSFGRPDWFSESNILRNLTLYATDGRKLKLPDEYKLPVHYCIHSDHVKLLAIYPTLFSLRASDGRAAQCDILDSRCRDPMVIDHYRIKVSTSKYLKKFTES